MPALAVYYVSHSGSPQFNNTCDPAVGKSSFAETKDLISFVRSNTNTLPPPDILSVGDCLQMLWANAGRDTAQVVEFQSIGDGAFGLLPHSDVCPPSTITHCHLPVSTVTLVEPDPARSIVAAILYSIVVRCQNTIRQAWHFAHSMRIRK